MRSILFLAFLIFISSCRSTQKVHDDVYDVSDHTTKSNIVYEESDYYRGYNDIIYNDPIWYNSSRFGFGFGMIGPPLYYGPWGNAWYWGNPYGYYNPWGYYGYYGCEFGYGYGMGYGYPYNPYGFHGYNTSYFVHRSLISHRPNMGDRIGISLQSRPPRSSNNLVRPERPANNATAPIQPSENRVRNNQPIRTTPRINPPVRTIPRNIPPRDNGRNIPQPSPRLSPTPRR